MVALVRHAAPAEVARAPMGAPRAVRGVPAARPERGSVEARGAPRIRVAMPVWLCAPEGSLRGWALEVSLTGMRVGGVGAHLAVGAQVIVKLAAACGEPMVVLRAEAVRYAPVCVSDEASCPELCLRLLDDAEGGPLQTIERGRLSKRLTS